MPIRVAFRGDHARYVDGMLRGVARYARPPRNWLITLGDNGPDYVANEGFAGILGQLGPDERLERYLKIGLPTVNLLSHDFEERVPSILLDNHMVGRMAAAHFRDRGFRHYGFVGNMQSSTYQRRYAGFKEAIADAAESFSIAPVQYTEKPQQFEAMLEWLKGLGKPVAIFAADDFLGLAVTQTCLLGGLHIPEEIAVLGVNNDDTPCEVSSPAMSSVVIPWERIGHEGALLLETLINGQTPEETRLCIPPTGIVTRGSTEISAIGDQEVAQVAGYIRSHAHEPISVKQILQTFPLARRSLEQRFRAVLGRTLLEEIHRVRIERAKEHLLNSRLRVRDIARETGFSGPLHLHRVFHQSVGLTPAAYRTKYAAR